MPDSGVGKRACLLPVSCDYNQEIDKFGAVEAIWRLTDFTGKGSKEV